jgi:LysR family nod box-dependent transcriptional activator
MYNIVKHYDRCVNLSSVDLNLLVSLDALLSERSVTRAAAKVGMSQPGMSSALARLRKLFDDPLLVRDGSGLAATARAQMLAQPVREALTIVEQAFDNRVGFDPARDNCTLTVSCSDYSLLILIGPLIRRLAIEAPGVTIQVQPRWPDPAKRLREGATDLVIEPDEILSGVPMPTQSLFVDRWLCCIWDGNTQVSDEMPLETYLGLGHLVYSMGAGQPTALADTHLSRLGVQRRVEFSVESFLLAPFLVQGTDLVTLVLERSVPLLERTAAIRLLEPPIELPLLTQTMCWSPSRTTDPSHRWLRAQISEVASALSVATVASTK